MQIVIDIDEEIYDFVQNTSFVEDENTLFKQTNVDRQKTLFLFDIIDAIRSGTQLPEHHGRLIDADELYGDFIDGTEGYDCQTWNRIEIGDIIEEAPTIIEADKAESEGE